MLKRAGYTQQPDSRAREGRQHPERDRQFRHTAARAREYLDAGQPIGHRLSCQISLAGRARP
jgi:Rhodopirellula transposase DDE domain